MISYSREPQTTIPTSSVKIVGLGGAGANMLERVALDGLEGAELLALNTDIRTLSACVAGEKIQLGRNLTKGLGSGGDPDLGHQAILEAEDEIRASLKGRRIVFLCTGLGGGTGSGAAPILTRIAREEGAFVVVFATMPFAFEGRRRREQAETALNELAVLSNALVTFDNNRMGELVLAKQGIHEAFSAADRMISESIKAVIRLVVRPGLINVGLDDLMSALRTTRSRCLFGSGIAQGKDRASRALRNVLASPLLDQGSLLKEARTVLIHLCGGEDLTLYEIELLMQRLQKFVPERAHVLFGAAVDPTMGDSLSITLISALPEDSLVAGPRDSLTRASEEPVLEPSDSYVAPTPQKKITPVLAEPVVVAVQPPVREVVKEPVSEPEFREEPALKPVERPVEKPVEKPRQAAPVSKPVAPASLFDDRPFAESIPVVQRKAEVVETVKPKPAPEPEPVAVEPVRPEPVLAEPEVEEEGPAPTPVAEEPALVPPPLPAKRVPDDFEDDEHDNPFTFAHHHEPLDLEEVEPDWLDDEATFPEPAAAKVDESELESEFEEEEFPKLTPPEPLKLRAKAPAGQGELSFEGGPRGRFEGESPNVFDGEDLDIPPFLRKKR
ncbi:hypothetical protein KBB96_00995 [Luteolibacter ambystomatis]|uniref:Cell division protein FtsZ n=1 Tax=Luteolibacter ambystomatis TaxID=2824561 RepID=A0A975G9C1_9BACT|nr:cell division protein FtsZ [Luteolibacter ambystomatis]QUE51489.1 hypothetical protein KBB96_00995 [Luteolibacter ambystomatis]